MIFAVIKDAEGRSQSFQVAVGIEEELCCRLQLGWVRLIPCTASSEYHSN